ncbi:hypothetical protein ACTQ2N_02135 [Ruminococcus sp. LCP21S3_E8]
MYKTIDELVEKVDERNTDEKVSILLGVSIDKCFIKSVANTNGTDLSKYKIIRKNDFAVSLMQVSRDSKIPIARLEEYDEAIMSPAYPIFRVKDESIILPEYLEMWFKRPEFDREAAFIAVGGVRGSMPWEDFVKMRLPVPPIDEQINIVKAYKTITDRITLKKQINDNLEATAQALYTSWFIDFEPFELDDDGFPLGWKKHTLNDKLTTSTQSVNPQKMSAEFVWHYSIPAFDAEKLPVNDETQTILSNKYIVPNDALLVSKLNPDTKRIWRTLSCFENAICSTEFIVFSSKQPSHRDFYYLLFNTKEFVDFLVSNATGSTNSRMRVKPQSSLNYEFICPDDKTIDSFCSKVKPLLDEIESNYLEIRNLNELLPLAVAKMMSSSR